MDTINGLFECFGSLFILLSIRQLIKDKQVRGFHWGHLTFFTTWGLWNLVYYPHLDQWVSFVGGIFVTLANVVYLALILYYRRPACKKGRLTQHYGRQTRRQGD